MIAQRRLIIAIVLCAIFMVVEIVAGVISKSLAIFTDAAHMLSDLSSFGVSLAALHFATLPGTKQLSFGYHRIEILGALFSILVIWAMTAWLVAAAVARILNPEEVKGPIMIYTAIFGIATNIGLAVVLGSHHHHHGHHSHGEEVADPIISDVAGTAAESYRATGSLIGGLLHHDENKDDVYMAINHNGHHHNDHHHNDHHHNDHHHKKSSYNVNLSAAYLHAFGDLIQNIGVLVAGVIIWLKPQYNIADPICTLIFSVVVFATTIGILKDVTNVLMEGTPDGIDSVRITNDIEKIDHVTDVHDVHIWSLSIGKPALACHLVVDNPSNAQIVLDETTQLVQNRYGILHTTIQVDFSLKNSACVTDAHEKCHGELVA